MQSNTKNFVYFQSENNESESTSPEISNESIKKALKTIASQILKEKTPSMKDLENILENKLQGTTKNPVQTEEQQEKEVYGNTEPMTKYLQKLGYLKDDNKWLTKKDFF